MNWILVAIGGAVGAMARHGLNLQAGRWFGVGLPWGTFIANIAGGLAMGLLVGWLALRGGGEAERWRLLLGVGLLGGFTTFSAFSLEVVEMIEQRHWEIAAIYIALSVALAVAAVFLGLMVARRVFA